MYANREGSGQKCRRDRPRGQMGFTLVEVSLALLVAGIGLLVVFSLFPSGLDQNRRSIDETRAAMFAEEVINGYRARIDADPPTWDALGPPSYADDPGLEGAATGMWTNWGQGITVVVTSAMSGNLKPRTVRYVDWNGIVQYAERYTLDISNVIPDRIKFARLRVWNGEYGQTNLSDAVEFYTEFYNYRMPPWTQ